MEVTVGAGVPADWSGAWEDELMASTRWRAAMGHRFTRPIAATARVDGRAALGLLGVVVEGPDRHPFLDPSRLLDAERSPFLPEGATCEGDDDLASLLPSAVMTWPGYQSFAAGSAAGDPAVVTAVVGRLEAWARAEGYACICFPYVAEGEAALETALRGSAYAPTELATESRLRIPAGGFEAYLEGLDRRSRQTVRSDRRHLERAGVRVEPATLSEELIDALVPLRVSQRRKYGLPGGEAAERARLEALATHLQRDTRVLLARVGDDVLNFCAFVVDPPIAHAVYTGTRYEDPRAKHAYFATSFYGAVERRSEWGVSEISYGFGADAAKRLRGCVAVPTRAWTRGLKPEAEAALEALARGAKSRA